MTAAQLLFNVSFIRNMLLLLKSKKEYVHLAHHIGNSSLDSVFASKPLTFNIDIVQMLEGVAIFSAIEEELGD